MPYTEIGKPKFPGSISLTPVISPTIKRETAEPAERQGEGIAMLEFV